ncbi:MAG TPA: hypothetical protein VFC78_21195 [Tepidisphaeraceae bacterium]|nr:hypothetical protein [Tepidisphaeraceae bacterium]
MIDFACGNAILSPADIEQQLAAKPHLQGDRRLTLKQARTATRDGRQRQDAAAAIGVLPGAGESLHLIIGGKFALWDLVPAMIRLAGSAIQRLHIATLGFSKKNIDSLCALLDAGQIGTARLLASLYFAKTSGPIFDHAEQQLGQRAGRASFLALRTHAKILLMQMQDGGTFTVESSANLRSCKNIEQICISADPSLCQFHATWIDELFTTARAGAKPK